LGAKHAQALYPGLRVAIVDYDVHHGNGTQEAFWEDDNVLFVCLHQASNYPQNSGAITDIGPKESYYTDPEIDTEKDDKDDKDDNSIPDYSDCSDSDEDEDEEEGEGEELKSKSMSMSYPSTVNIALPPGSGSGAYVLVLLILSYAMAIISTTPVFFYRILHYH